MLYNVDEFRLFVDIKAWSHIQVCCMVYDKQMASNDSFMHLVNLFELLSSSKRPLTFDEIVQELPGLPSGTAAKRQAFERAKSSLKSMGIPIHVVESTVSRAQGYIIYKKELTLDIRFSKDEEAALAFALSSVGSPAFGAASVLMKLGLEENPSPMRVVSGGVDAVFADLFQAIATKTPICFRYGSEDKKRELSPYGLLHRWGRWYLAGRESVSSPIKSFRVDRISRDVKLKERNRYIARPKDFKLDDLLSKDPWSIKVSEPETVVVAYKGDEVGIDWFFANRAETDVPGELSSLGTLGRRLRAVVVSNWDTFLSDAMSLGIKVEILSPQKARSLATSWLRDMVSISQTPVERANSKVIENKVSELAPKKLNVSSRKAIRRFELLAAILPFLGKIKEAHISDIARRFQVSEAELIEVLEHAATCGLPPYTPDQLYEIIVDPEEDLIEVRVDSALAEPRKLEFSEALLLSVTARTLVNAGVKDSGSLRSALSKLNSVISEISLQDDDLLVRVDDPKYLEELQRAVSEGLTVEVVYEGGGEKKERRLHPILLFVYEGKWYVRALDLDLKEMRHFVIERFTSLKIEEMSSGKKLVPDELLKFDPSDPFALRHEAIELKAWVSVFGLRVLDTVVGSYLEILDEYDDKSLVKLTAVSPGWLKRIFLRLGPHLVLDASASSFAPLQRSAAEELLEIYVSRSSD